MRQIAAEFLPFQMPGGQPHGLVRLLERGLILPALRVAGVGIVAEVLS
jgi:hypothetical protein